eukprot:TRINITY_DN60231_c0_g1_i1.p1 TRINITY_DN60231_c0_g1~~TRINITY_DN60231_c0_g1_i1.p1  ORF type:complete len:376 (+),score=50.94 TRINITY_DN60231_c0_g1_i1:106-1233(+)
MTRDWRPLKLSVICVLLGCPRHSKNGWGILGAAAALCQIRELTSLEGTFGGHGLPPKQGNMHSECAWQLNPGMEMQAIEFILVGSSSFVGTDALVVYGSMQPKSSSRVAEFDATNALPKNMALTGSNRAMFVLSAQSNFTHFKLRYNCRPYGTKIGNTWFSPVGYACVLAAFIVLGLSISLIPVYLVCYMKARWQRNFALHESSLTTFARRLRDAEAASISEQELVASLQALPTERWQDRETKAGQPILEECCLCLEHFLDEDIIRVLPCSHFFHQACVDDWFSARSFLPRTCPLCKRNPVALPAQTLPGAVIGDDVAGESVRQESSTRHHAAEDGRHFGADHSPELIQLPDEPPRLDVRDVPFALGRRQQAWSL